MLTKKEKRILRWHLVFEYSILLTIMFFVWSLSLIGDMPKASAIAAVLGAICLIIAITAHVVIKKKHYVIKNKKDLH